MSEVQSAVARVKSVMMRAAVETFKTGFVMAPQVHVFDESSDEQPYVGYVSCREYYRGQDAVAAIRDLGVIAAAMCGTRLVVGWEESDVRTSVYGPADHYPTGVALLETTFTSHALTWYPFRYVNTDGQIPGLKADFEMVWDRPSFRANGELPTGIRELVEVWRGCPGMSQPQEWVERTVTGALAAGYEIRPVQR
jgi:hypothetical protein